MRLLKLIPCAMLALFLSTEKAAAAAESSLVYLLTFVPAATVTLQKALEYGRDIPEVLGESLRSLKDCCYAYQHPFQSFITEHVDDNNLAYRITRLGELLHDTIKANKDTKAKGAAASPEEALYKEIATTESFVYQLPRLSLEFTRAAPSDLADLPGSPHSLRFATGRSSTSAAVRPLEDELKSGGGLGLSRMLRGDPSEPGKKEDAGAKEAGFGAVAISITSSAASGASVSALPATAPASLVAAGASASAAPTPAPAPAAAAPSAAASAVVASASAAPAAPPVAAAEEAQKKVGVAPAAAASVLRDIAALRAAQIDVLTLLDKKHQTWTSKKIITDVFDELARSRDYLNGITLSTSANGDATLEFAVGKTVYVSDRRKFQRTLLVKLNLQKNLPEVEGKM